ncbi:Bug family tripartite tricarboxylate transporter substrate binding protein [Paracraurococcus ruber]|uniref:Tat pathway signal protein n=1 Tax=Paracraurococcus ruber TaxID=77675 RepID=A0ABS1CUR8_9PROT|nr:tripartite tricarboxylate transporter substrate binding protein [Paracraurococcus ruber]MBK1658227.1 Tat pathway signal protein [Paracraurococcus ruber]TDG30596.1 tripartite tricarboxylate transporter substrate binding protein [Paracraurococcus ruber]
MTTHPRIPRRAALGLAAGGLALPALGIPGAARAQAQRGPGGWPDRPVNWIVGFPPGGQTDFAGRMLQAPFSTAIGQPVPIENRGGAGGNIAVEQVLRARPDGYTLTVGNIGTFVLNPHTMQGMNFDPLELVPIGLMLQSPLLLLVHPDVPARNFQEWVAWMRSQQPNGIDMGTTSAGGIAHGVSEKLRARLGNPNFNLIHYRGSGPALPDFIAGRYKTQFEAPSLVFDFVKDGKLRPILVTSRNRIPAFPDVPTAAEAGLPDFEVAAWIGLFGPRGLPAELAQHINAMLNIACRDQNARTRISERGDEIGGGGIEEFTARVRREHAEWGKIVREAGIRAE